LETEIAGREDTVRRSRLALLAARREDTNAGFVLIVDGVTHHHAVDTAAIPRTNGFGCAADAAAFAGPWGGGRRRRRHHDQKVGKAANEKRRRVR
jgi:L-ascorbate metabolism protein UlaG (beta-lactamase superfamily)